MKKKLYGLKKIVVLLLLIFIYMSLQMMTELILQHQLVYLVMLVVIA